MLARSLAHTLFLGMWCRQPAQQKTYLPVLSVISVRRWPTVRADRIGLYVVLLKRLLAPLSL
jgi:hypothetical protein